ncbi:centromere protein H (CENP-H)-domain-containing protein [Bipolaris maydis]|uniref:centromere protein H (CENP-H)-domain-containing protein n=1 Tax=Cochliobolus heterostrophus TaxID=5016 RepID=UPI0024D25FC9|nr:centromere protein H (CENP-H)-domain-containing protein [Bipolaris maydis]KAJ6266147.1 centromere protein H (CENP-H)-domain-containing protein [Bipolaris maydis]KAJ6281161.1 centromere protein H (CENP-H)-domain-containing protein [Bipolaris maydis]
MTTRGDVDMADVGAKRQDAHDDADLLQTTHSDAFAFSDTEMLALQLYDQLKELELQQSLLQAQQAAQAHDLSALPDDLVEERLTIAQREAMEAKTEYEIRNRITHNVLVMDPVRKAVHGGERTRFAEKRLLPLVTENDTVAMTHGAQTGRLASTTRALSAAEQGNMVANQKNRELAQTMLALAEEMKAQSVQDIEDAQLRSQVDAAEKQLAESRRRVKTLKGVLSGMIVGSGINWAADEGLTELVMDDEEDG